MMKLALAIALSILLPGGLFADDWKDESGKGRGKGHKDRQHHIDKHQEKMWKEQRKAQEKAREQWAKAEEHRRKEFEKAREHYREDREHVAEYHDPVYHNHSYYPPGPVYPPVPNRNHYYAGPNWNGDRSGYVPYPNVEYYQGYGYQGYYGANPPPPPNPVPPVYGYGYGAPTYPPMTVPYSPYYPVTPGAEKGARIGSRIGELIGGPEGAAVGAQIGSEIGQEVDRP